MMIIGNVLSYKQNPEKSSFLNASLNTKIPDSSNHFNHSAHLYKLTIEIIITFIGK